MTVCRFNLVILCDRIQLTIFKILFLSDLCVPREARTPNPEIQRHLLRGANGRRYTELKGIPRPAPTPHYSSRCAPCGVGRAHPLRLGTRGPRGGEGLAGEGGTALARPAALGGGLGGEGGLCGALRQRGGLRP